MLGSLKNLIDCSSVTGNNDLRGKALNEVLSSVLLKCNDTLLKADVFYETKPGEKKNGSTKSNASEMDSLVESWNAEFMEDCKCASNNNNTGEQVFSDFSLNVKALQTAKLGEEVIDSRYKDNNKRAYYEEELDVTSTLQNNNNNNSYKKTKPETVSNKFATATTTTKSHFNNNNRYDHDVREEEESNKQPKMNDFVRGGVRPFKPPVPLRPLGAPPPPPAASSSSVNKQQQQQHNALKKPNNSNNSFNAAKSAMNAISGNSKEDATAGEEVHPLLKNIPPELVERIENEILDVKNPIKFDDIAGLHFAKQCIEEMVVWPIKNPEFYTGLRKLPKGLLLFGPPGTGKTLIGKAIAFECNATFFSVSASTLTSKWIGEGEKMVRALFAVAAVKQPAVVFIDEIDSLLTQRTSDENEASRRIKTEFLVQLDGAATGDDDLVLIIGATNRPQELDEAARRRFVKRLYIPLPDRETRVSLLRSLLKKNENEVTEEQLEELGELTQGYSGADVANLASEASMGPLRDLLRRPLSNNNVVVGNNNNNNNSVKLLRKINRKDFDVALKSVKASVSSADLSQYVEWNNVYGTQQLIV